MARNEKDEEIAAIYAQHKEAFHDETVGFNRGPRTESDALEALMR